MENMQKFDDMMKSSEGILNKVRLENEYNGEIKIMQSFSKKNKEVYYTQPFEKDLDKLISNRTRVREIEVDKNLIIQKLQENSKYLRPTHPNN